MAKLILKCRYLQSQKNAHTANYIKYIARREGAEHVKDTSKYLSSTIAQKQLISNLLRDFPDCKDSFEYHDYLQNPTRGNASEFINSAIELHADISMKKKNYVDYIATRPGAEKVMEHGLFTDDGIPVVLDQVAKEVAEYEGNIWTDIISLRREDALRLGFDHVDSWISLLRSKRYEIADAMKIKPDNLKWYASFHNESHHPHVHLIVYSKDPNEAYLTAQGIEQMRSCFAREIFKQDLIQIYEMQTAYRNDLNDKARQEISVMKEKILRHEIIDDEIKELMVELSNRLKQQSGKKQYGYLKKPDKALVDKIMECLMEKSELQRIFALWYEQREAVLSSYRSSMPERLPIALLKEFRPIKNKIIQEAVALTGFYDKEFRYDGKQEDSEPDMSEDCTFDGTYAKWTKEYKLARNYLYGTQKIRKNLHTSLALLVTEAENGNAFAMADLGKMYHAGLGTGCEEEQSREWYAKALRSFLSADKAKPDAYLEYRIAKQYQYGLGTDTDEKKAYEYYEESAEKRNQFAQYSLGSMYLHDGKYDEALYWMEKSAEQRNAFASYQLAVMKEKGIGCEKDKDEAEIYYHQAFTGFEASLTRSRADTILYKLGFMCHTGKGCQKDDGSAECYLKESAELGNMHAEYQLAKIYLENDDKALHQNAIDLLHSSCEHKNPLAFYQLGCMYLNGEYVEQDKKQAIAYFKEADHHTAAQYQLSRIYLEEGSEYTDIASGLRYLQLAADRRHEYAQYQLANIFLEGRLLPQDIRKAEELLMASIQQGNVPAMCRYARLLLDGEVLQEDEELGVYYLQKAAEANSDYAQYQLGRYYLFHGEKEQAVYWLEKAKQAGNVYTDYLLEHMHEDKPLMSLTVSRLIKNLFQIFETENEMSMPKQITESKLAKKLRRKKMEQGQKFI